jgi:hypothetical protein
MSSSIQPAIAGPGAHAAGSGSGRVGLIQAVGWLVALALGARHLWHGRYQIGGDGVSYLDIGDAVARGDWATAITAYWSPLYASLVGMAIRILDPRPSWEFAVIAAVNFAVYVMALVSFQYLLTGILRLRRAETRRTGTTAPVVFPEWAWLAMGYAIFCWVSLQMITISNVAPDMALAAVTYLCAGLLLRIRAGDSRTRTMGALGAALGVGYLIKTPMFVLAPVFLICAAMAIGDVRRAGRQVAIAALVCAAIAGPYVIAISIDKHRFTFGDSGRINFAWDVNGVSRVFWQGGPPQSGSPLHPPRRIHTAPDVFEFARPIRATYPVWHDPSYWYDGVTPYFDANGLKRPWLESRALYLYLVREQAPFVLGVLALYLFAGGATAWWRDVWSASSMWIPAGAALAMFALAGAEPRYVAPFVALAMLAALSAVRLRVWRGSRPLLLVFTAVFLVSQSWQIVQGVRTLEPITAPTHPDADVVSELARLGVTRGDRVALVRPARTVYWARLAGVQIVAEIPRAAAPEFCMADPNARKRVLAAIAGTGAKVLVSSGALEDDDLAGWTPLGATGWRAYPLLDAHRPSP